MMYVNDNDNVNAINDSGNDKENNNSDNNSSNLHPILTFLLITYKISEHSDISWAIRFHPQLRCGDMWRFVDNKNSN